MPGGCEGSGTKEQWRGDQDKVGGVPLTKVANYLAPTKGAPMAPTKALVTNRVPLTKVANTGLLHSPGEHANVLPQLPRMCRGPRVWKAPATLHSLSPQTPSHSWDRRDLQLFVSPCVNKPPDPPHQSTPLAPQHMWEKSSNGPSSSWERFGPHRRCSIMSSGTALENAERAYCRYSLARTGEAPCCPTGMASNS